jgi:hypothetical protein
MYIKYLTGTQVNGVYWINLPTVGATQVYCLMDSKWAGGGWMMLMKGTRGTTFNYNANYWTTTNVLNESTGLNRNDGDAKFNSFNYYPCLDVLALWPDLTAAAGGSIAQTENWSWYVPNYFKLTSDGRATGLNGFSAANGRDVPGYSDPLTYPGFNAAYWSQQAGARRFHFGSTTYTGLGNASPGRWAFAWNNETDFNSNDVSGGIGLSYNSYSAGDTIGCCNSTTGLNRTMRFELYGR